MTKRLGIFVKARPHYPLCHPFSLLKASSWTAQVISPLCSPSKLHPLFIYVVKKQVREQPQKLLRKIYLLSSSRSRGRQKAEGKRKKEFLIWKKFWSKQLNLQGFDLVDCPAEVRIGQWLFMTSQLSASAAKVSMFWIKVWKSRKKELASKKVLVSTSSPNTFLLIFSQGVGNTILPH